MALIDLGQEDAASGVAFSEEPTASPAASPVKHVPGKGVHWATGSKAARNVNAPSR